MMDFLVELAAAGAEGLGGHSPAHELWLWRSAVVVFLTVIALLFVVLRRSTSRLELERAEEVIRRHDGEDRRTH